MSCVVYTLLCSSKHSLFSTSVWYKSVCLEEKRAAKRMIPMSLSLTMVEHQTIEKRGWKCGSINMLQCSIGDRDVLVLLNLLVMSPNSSTEIRTSKERKFQPISHHSFTPIRQGWLNYGDAKHWWKSNSKKISALICVLTLHKRTQLIKSISKIKSAKSNEGGEPPGIPIIIEP